MGPIYWDKRLIIQTAIIVAVAFSIGVVIGYFGKPSGEGSSDAQEMLDDIVADKFVAAPDSVKKALEDVDPQSIRDYHHFLSLEPHLAGLRRDNELTDWIKEEWEKNDLDIVDLAEYDFYLAWPNQTNPNKIHLLDGDDQVQFESKHKEVELREGDDHPDFIHSFLAFTPPGTVEGQIVYVNYARVEDIRELEDFVGDEDILKGKICIARYGKIFRGNKVRNCQDRGAIGVIIFSDPADVAVEGTTPDKVYPNTIFLPGSGIQRGATFIGHGDPLSPGWASVPNAYREETREVEGMPLIPAQPIGYDDAQVLMEKLGGQDPPSDKWKGKLDNTSYSIGGEFKAPWSDWKVRITTHNYEDTIKSSNVIGIIKGSVEPDRYVLMSNHRDAWGYGAIDPSSGTAQLMEVVRVLGEMKKKGWRPRRSLVFASMAAEESGLMGSYEWVYHHLVKFQQRTIGVLNTDICVTGPIAKPQASPMMQDIIVDALKHASDPTSSDTSRSYYDYWQEWYNQDNEGEVKTPKVSLLGSGTDHAAFAFYAGIPAINLRFKDDTKKYKGVGQYPMYHTGYETFYLVDEIIDPGYKIHKTCAQTSLHALLNMADSAILPYNIRLIPKIMQEALDGFAKSNTSRLLSENGATLYHVQVAVNEFQEAANNFMEMVENDESLKTNPIKQRMINDQLMQLERVFVMDGGLPEGRKGTRHAIFAPSVYNVYSGGSFPAISDLVHNIDRLKKGSKEHTEKWKTIKRHVSDLMIMIKSASRFLRPLENI